MKIDIAENEIVFDMGYRGQLDLTVKFTDQNNVEHSQRFEIRVFGEKPTNLTITKAPDPNERQTIFRMTERD